jgi:uroporphyrinogen decarboxylase
VGAAVGATAGAASTMSLEAAPMNKRDAVLAVLDKSHPQPYVPAAFFLHFDEAYHFGSAAVEKHLEYFRRTGMDFLKIQYERTFPTIPTIKRPEDWKTMPSYPLGFYEGQLAAVDGLVKAAKKEALVLITLYSPFMCAGHSTSLPLLTEHLQQDPEAVKKGFEAITSSLMRFVRECVRLGVDGFYASTQGGEANRFRDASLFTRYIKPYDIELMSEMKRTCQFNILHVCDYNAPYADFSAFADYPGHVVNCNPQLAARTLTWKEVARVFGGRPCMGGLDRHGIIAKGSARDIAREVDRVLAEAPRPFIIGADCTVPSEVSWDSLKAAIEAAHAHKG